MLARLALFLSAAFAGAACGDSAVAAIRVALHPDLSGSVVTSSLLVPSTAGPLEGSCAGVAWRDRAALQCAHGEFANIGELRIADVTFTAGTTPAGFSYVSMTVPGDRTAQWPAALLPANPDRDAARRAFDPHGELGAATTHVLLELEVPGEVLGNQVTPQPRGASIEHAHHRCSLILPVERALQVGAPLVWLVTWK